MATGNEFTTHPASRALWVGMYAVTFGLLVLYRVAVPIRDAFRYQLRVGAVEPESADAVSVYVTGRNLERMGAESGQFFRWRFLERRSWWEARPGDITLLYRATADKDLLFRPELDRLAKDRGIDVRYLLGRRNKRPDPLGVANLRHHVPHLDERDIYLCGPPGMMDRATKSLRSLGVRRSQIHRERFQL